MVDNGVVFNVPQVRKLAYAMLDLKSQLKREVGTDENEHARNLIDLAERIAASAVLLLTYFKEDDCPPPQPPH